MQTTYTLNNDSVNSKFYVIRVKLEQAMNPLRNTSIKELLMFIKDVVKLYFFTFNKWRKYSQVMLITFIIYLCM
jgi:hypothetical protein